MLKSYSVATKNFKELTKTELYAILALRVEVFCVEQNCPYQDIDGLDRDALHVFIHDKEHIFAYARIIKENKDTCHIGRVVVSPDSRKQHLATKIMHTCIKEIKKTAAKRIEISAQSYLTDFYQGIGFQNTGKYYLEDEIPHQQMVLIII